MTALTRKEILGLLGAALLAHGCSAQGSKVVRVGSATTSENATVAEIYALTLEKAGVSVARHMNAGNASATLAALERGEIDLFPGYVRTSRGSIAGAPLLLGSQPGVELERRGVTWLTPAPMNASPALATSTWVAEQFWLVTLSTCARVAPRLRLVATHDFLAPGGALERLQAFYGGFRFKSVTAVEPGRQYDTLGRGEADIASAFTTDAAIAEIKLNVLADDKHFWPKYSVTPVVRAESLHVHPALSQALDRVSALLNIYAIQMSNMRVDLNVSDPMGEADYFVTSHHG